MVNWSLTRQSCRALNLRAVGYDDDRHWATARGDRLGAERGDRILDNGGPPWSVSDEVSLATYVPVHDLWEKRSPVGAVQVKRPDRFNPEGEATAERGDWLVRNRTREIWPMTAVVFAETYGEL